MGFNKMVEPGEVGDCDDEALPDKGVVGGGGGELVHSPTQTRQLSRNSKRRTTSVTPAIKAQNSAKYNKTITRK